MAKNNIIIASLNPNLYSTIRLIEEAQILKRSPIYINPFQFLISQQKTRMEGHYFHRTTGTNYDDFDLLVSRHHESLGMKVTNPIERLKLFRSKDQQTMFFKEHNLPSIKTLMFRGNMDSNLETELNKLSPDKKYILKMSRGNQGIGVNYLEGTKSLQSVLETFNAMKDQKFIVQPYITHKKEWRLFIVRGEIIACIEKTLIKTDFRGNAKRSNGKILKKVPAELQVLAINAFNFSGLDYAGVDILLTESGEMLILEINPVPGFEQVEKLSDKNVARELINIL